MLLALALHTFLLMGTGTWSDLAMVGESFAATFYYAREGVLAAGFLLYAVLASLRRAHFPSSKTADGLLVAAFVLFAGCVLALLVFDSPAVRIVSVLVVALLIGLSGGMVYERVALMAQQVAESGVLDGSHMPDWLRGDSTRVLGVVVGGGGALAVVVQCILQIALSLDVWLSVCFVACFGLLMWLSYRMRFDSSAGHQNAKGADSRGITPLVCIIVTAMCLFALFLFYEAVLRGAGAVAFFYEWHRLFLAIGYVAIGALAFFRGRPAASIAVLVAVLFAIVVLMQTVMLEAGPATAILYYTLLGVILAWNSIMFMSAAVQSSRPALVASLGRVLSEAVTVLGIFVPADVDLPVMTVLVAALVMLAVAIVSMVKGGFLVFPEHGAGGAGALPEQDVPSPEQRVQLLARESGLTAREEEVLSALVLTENKNQQIADDMGISRRQLQTHISRIYEKTDTTTRAGLVMRVNGEAGEV